MDIKEAYTLIGGDYSGVLGRFGKTELVYKFAKKFSDDPSYKSLCASLDAKDYGEALRAAHTLKGVCANLGLTKLCEASSLVTEELRAGRTDKLDELMPTVAAEYNKAVSALRDAE